MQVRSRSALVVSAAILSAIVCRPIAGGVYDGLIVNEILADPGGDANRDGIWDSQDDEFIELVNGGSSAIDVNGITISDEHFVRHTFSSHVMDPNTPLVVFGGGSLLNFTPAPAQIAASGSLSLNNSGDTVTVRDPIGNVIAVQMTWGVDQSITRDPDITGEFVDHTTTAAGLIHSPGLKNDGRSFYLFDHCDFTGEDLCDETDLDLMHSVGPIAPGVPATGNELFDMNGDGFIDLDDRDEWLEVAAVVNQLGSPYKLGDANIDGVVDGQDFIAWNGTKFTSTLLWSDGNFNGDSVVDGQDFILWNGNKFTSSDGLSTVPEPATGLIASVTLLFVRWARKRQAGCSHQLKRF